jgi:type I restriction enzyme, S subunit
VNAVLKERDADARHLGGDEALLVRLFELVAKAPDGIRRLRRLIQALAIRGQLLPQQPGDEPASTLLQQIRQEKSRRAAGPKARSENAAVAVVEGDEPFPLPSGWVWTRFGDVTINRDGERVPVSATDRETRAKVYDYYGASGVIDKIDSYLFDKTLLLIGEDGANLLNRSSPIAFLAHGKYWVNNHAHVVDTDPGLMRYLELFVNAISLDPYVTGTAQPKMNQAKMNSIVIALPPLAEQARIVVRVGELMRLCDALEANGRLEAEQHERLLSTLLGTLTDSRSPGELAANWQRVAAHFDLLLDRPEAIDTLEQAIIDMAARGAVTIQPMANAVTRSNHSVREDCPAAAWPIVRFAELLEDLRYGTAVKCSHDPVGVPVIRIPNLRRGEIDTSDLKYGALNDREQASLRLRRDDLLLVRSNGSASLVGTMALVGEESEGFAFAGYLVRARVNQKRVDPRYVLLVSQSENFRRQVEIPIRTTSGVKNINSSEISALTFPLPSLPAQRRIISRVNELRRLCADLRERLTAQQATQGRLADALLESATAD